MRLFGEADYHFIERRKRAYRVSTAAMLAGIVTMVINIATRGTWQNYGVDFTGRPWLASTWRTSPSPVGTLC